MSTNAELARIFEEMASVLELTGANPFRINSYHRAARVMRDITTDVATLVDEPKELRAIEGVGDGTAKRIIEYCKTGQIKDHQELIKTAPLGLLDVLRVPGLGPKTVKMLWEEAGVTNIPSLKAALEAGQLEDLPRLGAKSIQNIRDSIAFAEKTGQRTRLGQALPIAETIVELLRRVPGAKQVEYAGSLRRGRETIGDIDILAAAKDWEPLAEAFTAMEGVEKVLVSGGTKCSVRLSKGLQVDLRIVPEESFGAAMMYFTGSKEHNIVLRERAIKRGLRLNEYGLFADDDDDSPPQHRGVSPLAARTESDIYDALEVPHFPPELREERTSIAGVPPKLIELQDVRAELHAHTTASDGKLSIAELADEAKRRGFHTIAVTDHSQSSPLAGGLSPDRLLAHTDAVHEANERIDGITILAGSEVDILVDGSLDYDDELLAKLDIVVASPHVSLSQDREKATKRLLAAIRHPLVHILGHPTGRLINKREGLSPDIDAIVEAAAECDTALELNASFMRLDLRDTHLKAAIDAGVLVAINTDAHSVSDFDHLRWGVLTARRGWVTKKDCINTWNAKKLHAWLKKKR